MQYPAKVVVIVVTMHVLLRDVHKSNIIRNINSIISLGYMQNITFKRMRKLSNDTLVQTFDIYININFKGK